MIEGKKANIITVALDNCLRVMGYPENHDNESVKLELLSNDFSYDEYSYIDPNTYNNLEKKYCDPFKEELDKNLSQKENPEGLKAVIRNYISIFREQGFPLNPDELYNGSYPIDIYQGQCRRIYSGIFLALDIACTKYGINFNSIMNENSSPKESTLDIPTKLKWLGKPEQFGYIFSELARNGFIELPTSKGVGSIAKYAKFCFELFEFKSKTTTENLERVLNPVKNCLSDSNRAKITIPDIKDIS